MIKPTYKDIGSMVGKTETTIKSWKGRNEELLQITRLGAICKANGITEEDLEALIQLKQSISSRKD
ncbi:hypothetical protein [Halarcobacter sp.]|uniref:hypothetical protein n=1 Tax=Halarcobacter sp. TaxID=2321133 RepID=UPI0029F58591|nr:hypothetical protein [Halarcobacter sp.]